MKKLFLVLFFGGIFQLSFGQFIPIPIFSLLPDRFVSSPKTVFLGGDPMLVKGKMSKAIFDFDSLLITDRDGNVKVPEKVLINYRINDQSGLIKNWGKRWLKDWEQIKKEDGPTQFMGAFNTAAQKNSLVSLLAGETTLIVRPTHLDLQGYPVILRAICEFRNKNGETICKFLISSCAGEGNVRLTELESVEEAYIRLGKTLGQVFSNKIKNPPSIAFPGN